jgi:hypothetical protein
MVVVAVVVEVMTPVLEALVERLCMEVAAAVDHPIQELVVLVEGLCLGEKAARAVQMEVSL